MITLIRTIRLWQLRTKWKLAFWQFVDEQATELMKNPDEIKREIVNALAEVIHSDTSANKGSK